jgi:hypothetical protein
MKVRANALFEEELARRGLAFERDGEWCYRFLLRGVELIVNLENVARNAEREDDPSMIRRFAEQVLDRSAEKRGWAEASASLRFLAEPADVAIGDAIHIAISDRVIRVLTLADGDEYITFVTPDMCAEWGVSPETASEAALRNQDRMLAEIRLKVDDVDGHKLGMVPLDSPYKASVIFAPAFKDLVTPVLGWPVLVVIPCRDFIYVLADESQLIGRIGGVVVDEYRTSGYPITTEVLRISDSGIEAIGSYAP